MQRRGNGNKALTGRERDLLVERLSAKQIALRLGIARRTGECHIDHLRSKTHSRNRTQMVALAVRSGLLMGAELKGTATA